MINNNHDGSGKRLFNIRKKLGMTQLEFAKIINSSNGHVSDMEKDRKNITESTIELLKLKCNVNEEYLRTGRGDIFFSTPSNTMEQLKKEFNLDEFSYHLVYEYLKLGQEQRKSVRDFLYKIIDEEDTTSSELFEDDIPDTFEEMEKKLVKESIRSDVG